MIRLPRTPWPHVPIRLRGRSLPSAVRRRRECLTHWDLVVAHDEDPLERTDSRRAERLISRLGLANDPVEWQIAWATSDEAWRRYQAALRAAPSIAYWAARELSLIIDEVVAVGASYRLLHGPLESPVVLVGEDRQRGARRVLRVSRAARAGLVARLQERVRDQEAQAAGLRRRVAEWRRQQLRREARVSENATRRRRS